jgi:hypothetical protein
MSIRPGREPRTRRSREWPQSRVRAPTYVDLDKNHLKKTHAALSSTAEAATTSRYAYPDQT